jgi:zeaxanthin glucosyltransferase
MVDQASDAIARTGVDALLVDQVAPAGETVAEMLNLPFVSVCNAFIKLRPSSSPSSSTLTLPSGHGLALAQCSW